MISSRVTFATTDAAAMEMHASSPLMIDFWGMRMAGSLNASSSRWSGRMPSERKARTHASLLAGPIPITSIKPGDTIPTPTPSATSRIRGRSRSLVSGESILLSRSSSRPSAHSGMPSISSGRGNTTAPATSGPAHAPRPASSTPAITRCPFAYSSCSKSQLGDISCLLLFPRSELYQSAPPGCRFSTTINQRSRGTTQFLRLLVKGSCYAFVWFGSSSSVSPSATGSSSSSYSSPSPFSSYASSSSNSSTSS